MTPRKETIAEGVELWLGDCREVLPLLFIEKPRPVVQEALSL